MRHFFLIGIIVLCAGNLLAQEQRIFLHTGNSITGTVIAQNEQVIMLKTSDGQTLQYPAKEIKAVVDNTIKNVKTNTGERFKAYTVKVNDEIAVYITPEGQLVQYPIAALKKNNNETPSDNNKNGQNNPLGLQLAIKAGSTLSDPSFNMEGNLVIGYRNILQQRFFVGIGTGFIIKNGEQQQTLVPLFMRIEYHPLHQSKWSPFIGLDGGYMFQITHQQQGGAMTELSVGARLNFGKKPNALQLSVYGKAYQGNTTLTEYIDNRPFTRNATATTIDLGARIAILF